MHATATAVSCTAQERCTRDAHGNARALAGARTHWMHARQAESMSNAGHVSPTEPQVEEPYEEMTVTRKDTQVTFRPSSLKNEAHPSNEQQAQLLPGTCQPGAPAHLEQVGGFVQGEAPRGRPIH